MNREKAEVFVKHIENHLKKENPEWEVICKICGKTIDEIYEAFLERMGEKEKVVKTNITQKDLVEGIK